MVYFFLFLFFNLHLVFLPPPLPAPQNVERIERDFYVLLLFILWMFSSGSTCASGRNETCLANGSLLWDMQISEEL